jgi:uncharacterized protein YciI
MHYILFYDYIEGIADKRGPHRAAHFAHLNKSYNAGEIVLAGALADPIDGAVIIFRTSSPDAAERFAQNDPYVQNGLVTNWRVRKWTTVVGEGSTPPQL